MHKKLDYAAMLKKNKNKIGCFSALTTRTSPDNLKPNKGFV
jgi:hypothetical protein